MDAILDALHTEEANPCLELFCRSAGVAAIFAHLWPRARGPSATSAAISAHIDPAAVVLTAKHRNALIHRCSDLIWARVLLLGR